MHPIRVALVVLFAQVLCLGQEKAKQPTIVGKIVDVRADIQTSEPPNLVVTAVGEVPTSGFTKPMLVRAVYVMPPDDGIQDYFLLATPPSGIVAQVISKVTGTDTWKNYKKEAPWIKGVRVHGIGDGIVVKML